MYGNSAAFFVVSTAFLQKRDRESYPRAAENRLQRRAGRACAGLRREGWAKYQGNGGRAQDGRVAACVRCSVGVAACGHRRREARKRRTGARHHRRHANKRHQWRERATRILGKQSIFLFYAALLSKRLRASSAEKQIRTRAADTIPPYLRFRSWGLRTPAGGQALIARGQNFQGGATP